MLLAFFAVWAAIAAVFRFEPLPTQWFHSSPIWAPTGPTHIPAVPEPATYGIFAIGLVGLMASRRRRGR